MHETVGDSGCVWIGQVSAGLSWFQDTAVGEIDESVTQGSVIIINMGVNDLGNAWGYIDLLKEKIPQWMEKGIFPMRILRILTIFFIIIFRQRLVG